jgi:hypothetical protein
LLHLAARPLHRHVKSLTPGRDAAASTSFAEKLGDLAQRLLGTLVVLAGLALTLTLWLLPVGLPLALLGCALMAAPRDNV